MPEKRGDIHRVIHKICMTGAFSMHKLFTGCPQHIDDKNEKIEKNNNM